MPSMLSLLLKMFLWRGRVLCNFDEVAFSSIIFDKVMVASRFGEYKEKQLDKNHQNFIDAPSVNLQLDTRGPVPSSKSSEVQQTTNLFRNLAS